MCLPNIMDVNQFRGTDQLYPSHSVKQTWNNVAKAWSNVTPRELEFIIFEHLQISVTFPHNVPQRTTTCQLRGITWLQRKYINK